MTVTTINVQEAQAILKKKNTVLIDVREVGEFQSCHIKGAVNLPLSEFNSQKLHDVVPEGAKCVVHCLKGSRAANACHIVEEAGRDIDLLLLEGGISAWKSANFAVIDGDRKTLPLDQQVQLTIGLILLVSTILGATVCPHFFYVAGFIGAGLAFAGLTGNCMLARIIAKMPWNK